MPAKNGIGLVHITHNDGDMLEPEVVAAGINGERSALRSQELPQLDTLLPQLQPGHADSCTRYPEQMFNLRAGRLRLRDLAKGEHVGKEIDGTVEIAHRKSDGIDARHADGRGRGGDREKEKDCRYGLAPMH